MQHGGDSTASDPAAAAAASAAARGTFANDSLTGRVRDTYDAICALRNRDNLVLQRLNDSGSAIAHGSAAAAAAAADGSVPDESVAHFVCGSEVAQGCALKPSSITLSMHQVVGGGDA